MSLRIRPVFTGILPNSERSIQQYLTGFGEKIEIHSYIWVIEGGDAPVIVDLGVGSSDLVMEHHGRVLSQPLGPLEALEAAGVDRLAVRTVIQTHLHWDHCLGFELDPFPNAAVYVQEDELRYSAAPFGVHTAMYNPTVVGRAISRTDPTYRIRAVSGDWTAADGIRVIHTPGHTPGLQIPLVSTDRGTYAVGSDNVPLATSMRGATSSEWIPPGIHVDLAQTYRSMARLRDSADVILPSHDGSVLSSAVYPAAGDGQADLISDDAGTSRAYSGIAREHR